MNVLRAGIPYEPTPGQITLVKYCLFVLPFLMLVPVLWEKLTNPWNFWQFVQEDGPVEWATALVYLFAVPVALTLAMRFRAKAMNLHAFLIAGLAAAMFFVGMEEISWGQRVFGVETPPSLAEVNHQQEINLHNIIAHSTVQLAFVIIGLYGIFASWIMPALLKPFFGARAESLADLVSPPDFLKSFFFVSVLFQVLFLLSPALKGAFGPAWGWGHLPDEGYFLLGRDREVAECIQAMGFALFTLWLVWLERQGRWSAQAANESAHR